MNLRGLAVLLLLLPAAYALGTPQVHVAVPGTELGAQAGNSTANSTTTQAAVNNPLDVVILAGLGDVNGDGKGDLLQVVTSYTAKGDGATTKASARSGADLSIALWSYESPADMSGFVYPFPDVDGDGIADPLARSGIAASGTASSTGGGPANVYSAEFSGTSEAQVLSGRTGAPLATFQVPYESSTKTAYASGVAAFAYVSDNYFGGGGVTSPAVGSIVVGDSGSGYTWTFVASIAADDSWFSYYKDFDVQVFSTTGSKGAAASGGDRIHTGGYALASLDGAPGLDVAVSELADPLNPLGQGVRVYRPTYSAQGAAGEMWTLERDPVLSAYGPIQLGDMDGDGDAELEFLEASVGGATTLILDGRSGAILTQAASGTQYSVLMPFGNTDVDKELEALHVVASSTGATVGVSGLDMKDVWSTIVAPDDDLLDNIGRDGLYKDLTGNGAPDLVVLRDYKGSREYRYESDGETITRSTKLVPFSFTIEVRDGRDGAQAWSLPFADINSLGTCGDMDGRGGEDICISIITGDKAQLAEGDFVNATLGLTVLAGEDGTVLMQQVLRSPAATPLGDTGNLRVSTPTVGDLDGDKRGEIAVLIQTEGRVLSQGFDLPNQAWYILGLASATPVAQVANVAPAGNPTIDIAAGGAPDLPAATSLVGAEAPAPESTPGIGLLAALAVVGVTIALRRHKQ